MRKIAGPAAIVVGIVMAIAGVVTWVVVSSHSADQKITVSDDANCAAGDHVNGPISAYCQADIIDHHTQGITGGKTYAELAPRTTRTRDRDGLRVPAGLPVHLGRRLRSRCHGVRPRTPLDPDRLRAASTRPHLCHLGRPSCEPEGSTARMGS